MTFLYFNVDIWGTVSDWFILMVTTITAFYLYRTLQSQKTVQKIQQDLFLIEKLKFNESIMPKINVHLIQGNTKKLNQSFFIVEITNQSPSIAHNISFNCIFGKCVSQVDMVKKLPNNLKNNDEPIMLFFHLIDNSIIFGDLKIEFTYKDIVGNKYQQHSECKLGKFDFRIESTLPTLITQ
jgi:hypothetical protein